CGFSTLTTSAPSHASASVHDGPASNWVRSRTRTPARKAGNLPFVAIVSFLPSAVSVALEVDVVDIVGALGIRGKIKRMAGSKSLSTPNISSEQAWTGTWTRKLSSRGSTALSTYQIF